MSKVAIETDLANLYQKTVKGNEKGSSGIIYVPRYLIGKKVYVIVQEEVEE